MSTKKERMYQAIEKHGKELIEFFKLKDAEPVKLCKQLFRIENKAHHATTCICNTNTLEYLDHPQAWTLKQATEEEQDAFFDGIRKSLERVLGKDNAKKCFINHDPRGYALKIKEKYSKDFHNKDWGGYGILAPDFSEIN